MILFEEALTIIRTNSVPLPTEIIRLGNCTFRVLAEDIYSDIDIPPFNKSAVDGYACRRADLEKELKVLETIPAGRVPEKFIEPSTCSKLMTGGMLPDGADTVIMVEDVEITGIDTIRFVAQQTASNYSIKAEDISKGEKVLTQGTLLRAQEIAILASVGCVNPRVYKQARIGIISTGDELVEPDFFPASSQIRNSNAYQLIAQVQQANCISTYFGIARDTEAETLQLMQQAASESDIVILTGGISAGDFDFVPAVIEQAGFDIKFRSIAVQPGKPVIFATKASQYIVALPGNPVSSFVQFELLVKFLINLISGSRDTAIELNLPMGVDIQRKKNVRKAFYPVRISDEGKVFPVEYHGSAHIHSYINADGILTLEIGESGIKKGELAHVRLL